jgi:hypothetical protein
MRAPGNWRPDQKSAHAILTSNDIPTANSILKDGLVIEGCRLQARKLEEEPKRCFKCQKFSTRHTAANCQEITDWCPNCAGPHSVTTVESRTEVSLHVLDAEALERLTDTPPGTRDALRTLKKKQESSGVTLSMNTGTILLTSPGPGRGNKTSAKLWRGGKVTPTKTED